MHLFIMELRMRVSWMIDWTVWRHYFKVYDCHSARKTNFASSKYSRYALTWWKNFLIKHIIIKTMEEKLLEVL